MRRSRAACRMPVATTDWRTGKVDPRTFPMTDITPEGLVALNALSSTADVCRAPCRESLDQALSYLAHARTLPLGSERDLCLDAACALASVARHLSHVLCSFDHRHVKLRQTLGATDVEADDLARAQNSGAEFLDMHVAASRMMTQIEELRTAPHQQG